MIYWLPINRERSPTPGSGLGRLGYWGLPSVALFSCFLAKPAGEPAAGKAGDWAGPNRGKKGEAFLPRWACVFPRFGKQGKTVDFAIIRIAFPGTGLAKP